MVTQELARQLAALTPRAALRAVQTILEQAGCPDADFDARELYRMVSGRDPRLADAPLPAPQAERLAELTARRADREPLQYLAGEWDFLDFTLRVGPGVLCPRADSEVVCETAVDLLRQAGRPDPLVLDLCAGTGCLGLGVRRFLPQARVFCVEKSPAALRYLLANTAGTGVAAVEADVLTYWQTLPPATVDLILCNPPYLTAAEMADLMPETAREPAMALDGGTDGLDFYRAIAANYRQTVRPGGSLVFEIGCAQRRAVKTILADNGWTGIDSRRDYGGNDRAVWAFCPDGARKTS
ncbi:MAG: peptide chain release factor N(5)-glutamine methyltransferase [Gemmiger sp.]|uniref:peptide chain release factor N(5)-glutamine methyltransferase n=1 Tax=Gemmiger sp. TaxID=2049027 RepID=UPI002E7892BF|nr:peptide chain release factor N(5)-glutamine methyltransferase [Gemmiger sp.]MEE0801179.1 peptide chain release factor N(5)-glutamine methyltransferase [Gemmiger sp.]